MNIDKIPRAKCLDELEFPEWKSTAVTSREKFLVKKKDFFLLIFKCLFKVWIHTLKINKITYIFLLIARRGLKQRKDFLIICRVYVLGMNIYLTNR